MGYPHPIHPKETPVLSTEEGIAAVVLNDLNDQGFKELERRS